MYPRYRTLTYLLDPRDDPPAATEQAGVVTRLWNKAGLKSILPPWKPLTPVPFAHALLMRAGRAKQQYERFSSRAWDDPDQRELNPFQTHQCRGFSCRKQPYICFSFPAQQTGSYSDQRVRFGCFTACTYAIEDICKYHRPRIPLEAHVVSFGVAQHTIAANGR